MQGLILPHRPRSHGGPQGRGGCWALWWPLGLTVATGPDGGSRYRQGVERGPASAPSRTTLSPVLASTINTGASSSVDNHWFPPWLPHSIVLG